MSGSAQGWRLARLKGSDFLDFRVLPTDVEEVLTSLSGEEWFAAHGGLQQDPNGQDSHVDALVYRERKRDQIKREKMWLQKEAWEAEEKRLRQERYERGQASLLERIRVEREQREKDLADRELEIKAAGARRRKANGNLPFLILDTIKIRGSVTFEDLMLAAEESGADAWGNTAIVVKKNTLIWTEMSIQFFDAMKLVWDRLRFDICSDRIYERTPVWVEDGEAGELELTSSYEDHDQTCWLPVVISSLPVDQQP